MSKRVDCPTCGTRISEHAFSVAGCWYCKRQEESREEDSQFREFMEKSEEERWREVWEKIK